MRLIAFIEWAAVVIGVGAIVAGRFFALPQGLHLGVFLVGAGFALGGLEALAMRRMPFRMSDDAYESYAGLPALIVGLMVLLVGAAVIGAAYLLEERMWHATVSYLARRPAPVLAAGGLLLAGIGVLMMLNPQGDRGMAWTLLVRAPSVLLGVIVATLGAASVILGVWEYLDPAAFDRLAASAQRQWMLLR